MSAPLKLSLFGLGLLAAFGLAYYAGYFLIPGDFVDSWIHTPSH